MSALELMELSIVQQLEAEVSLLVRELKDRDRELNSMVMSHQQQLACWNQDREGTLRLREQLTLSEERNLTTKRELRNVQGSVNEYKEQGTRDRSRVGELESSLANLREENEQLSLSLRSADSKVAELSSNEQQIRNALKLTLEGAESMELDLQEKTGCLEELNLIRQENEQLREDTNSSRERCLQLSNQIEALRRQMERERETANHKQIKLQNSVSTLERQLEVYRTAEERKTQLLASYRSKQERIEAELRAVRELAFGHNYRPLSNGHTSPVQVRSDFISPQRPTRDMSPSSPRTPQRTRDLSPSSPRTRDEPFPGPSSPVFPYLLRPCTLEIIRDEDETEFVITQEMKRVASSFELTLDTILHSIEPPQSPWNQRSLSVIPEEDTDPLDLKIPPRDTIIDQDQPIASNSNPPD